MDPTPPHEAEARETEAREPVESPAASAVVVPRVWPVVTIVAIQLAAMVGTSWFAPETMAHVVGLFLSPIAGSVLVLLWWLLASRVPWKDRLVGVSVVAAATGACALLAHESVRITLVVYGLTSLTAMVAMVLLATGTVPWPSRRRLLAAVVLGICAVWTTLRLDGLDGDFLPELAFRWSPTAEQEFLEHAGSRESPEESLADDVEGQAPSGGIALPVDATPADWPGFRGRNRDGTIDGVTFSTDWSERPPRERWRRKVGPGWSSFTVVAPLVFTQEQRGPEEFVVAYRLEDGEEVWTNQVEERFEETVAGPGPRATPTYDRGRLYTLGATGIAQCLEPATGSPIWRRDLRSDVGAEVPTWGFASSPLVFEDLVIVFSGAGGGQSVVAYDRDSGEPRWTGGDGKLSYSSCHLARISETDQVLMYTEVGLQSLDARSGNLLWEHRWELKDLNRVVQPLVLDDDSVLLGTSFGHGTRRVSVTHIGGAWENKEEWTSRALKPYFNDGVYHDGSIYGFDARIFACIDVESGERRWKGGRYGHGQVLLIADMGVLLVLSERGELVLVEANPERHHELGRIEALSGKTWNHPVIAHGRLLVRNGAEAVCFDLPQ